MFRKCCFGCLYHEIFIYMSILHILLFSWNTLFSTFLETHHSVNVELIDAIGMTAFTHAKEKKFKKIVAMIDPNGKMEAKAVAKAKMEAKRKVDAKARSEAKRKAMAMIEEEKIKNIKKKEREGMPKKKKSASASFEKLFLFLKKNQLEQYGNNFLSNGYDELKDLLDMTEEDLIEIGMTKKKDYTRFLSAVRGELFIFLVLFFSSLSLFFFSLSFHCHVLFSSNLT